MTEKKMMNLAFEPWIPVIYKNGRSCDVSLLDIFTKGENIHDLAVRPHEFVALMRLLICIAHAALNGPKDYDEWKETPKNLANNGKKYLAQWEDFFWLFHPERPFAQINELNYSKTSNVIKLDFAYSTGHNTTLFDHGGKLSEKRFVQKNKLAIDLLTYLNFSPGGGVSPTQWKTPEYKTNNVGNPDAPCITGSMLHSFIKKDSVFDTVVFNLPHFENQRLDSQKIGKPIWEMMPKSPEDKDAIANATMTYIGRLVPISRWIKLYDNCIEMQCGNGFKYMGFKDGYTEEPSATVYIKTKDKKEEKAVLAYHQDRFIWRDLSAIVVKKKTTSNQNYGPLFLENINNQDCIIKVMSLSRDQATILDSVDSIYNISSKIFTDDGRTLYEALVYYSEIYERKLSRAITVYRKNIDSGWEGRLKNAGKDKYKLIHGLELKGTIHYWTMLDNYKFKLFDAVANIEKTKLKEDNINFWKKKVVSTAIESYKMACENETVRGIKAFAIGLKVLISKPDDRKNEKIKGE